MTNFLGKFGLGAIVAAFLALLAWGEYEFSWLLTTALLTWGAGLITGSIEILLTQRGQQLKGIGRWEQGWGIGLYPWSFVFLFIGLSLFTLGMVHLLGWSDSFTAYLSRRPGAALIAGGLAMAGSGVAAVIGPDTWRDSRWDFIVRLPARLIAGLMVIAGLAAVMLGLFETLSPAGFDQWLAAALGPFAPPW
jgi:hypothetical protein